MYGTKCCHLLPVAAPHIDSMQLSDTCTQKDVDCVHQRADAATAGCSTVGRRNVRTMAKMLRCVNLEWTRGQQSLSNRHLITLALLAPEYRRTSPLV